ERCRETPQIMNPRSRAWWLCALPLVAACSWIQRDPRQALASLGVPYSTDSFLAQSAEGDVEAVRMFLASGMAVDVHDKHGVTPLMNAAAAGQLRVAEALIEHHANVNASSPAGTTPLMAAAWNGNKALVELLLNNGANVNAKDRSSESALMLAVRARHAEVVKVLLDKGARADAHDDTWPALSLAAFLGDAATIDVLASHDAALDGRDDRGMTPLMHAASAGRTDAIKMLVK